MRTEYGGTINCQATPGLVNTVLQLWKWPEVSYRVLLVTGIT